MARGPSRTLKLQYVGDASSLNKANQEAESGLEKLGNTFAKVGKAVAIGVAAAGAALGAFAKKSIDAAIEAEAAQTRLATILKNTGLATEDQVKALNDQATALEKVGVASSSNITVLQAQLATFDLTADTIKTLTPAIVDYVIAEKGASASAGDFQSAANGLAQALNGNFASLTRTGFVLDEVTKELITNGTEAERAAALVDVLSSTYAGFNEAARETSEGQLVALKNAFGALQEQIGGALLPVFNELVEGAGKIVSRLQELWEVHGPAVIERFERMKERAGELFTEFRERLPEALEALRDKFGGTGEAIVNMTTYLRELSQVIITELQERKAFEGIRDRLKDINTTSDDTLASFNNLIAAFSSGDVTKSGSAWATIVQLQYIGPIEKLLEVINGALEAIGKLFDVVASVRRLPETLRGFRGIGEALELGEVDFFAGRPAPTAPSRPSVVVNVSGAIDPEGTARVIQRTLNGSALRVGQVPVAGLVVAQ